MQFMFSMGQSGALAVVGLAVVVVVVVVPFAVVPPAVVDFMVVVAPDPPPPPPIGMQASDWRTAAMAIKIVNLVMTLALQKCQLDVTFAFKSCLFIQKQN